MSEVDLNEEFETLVGEIEAEVENFTPDEQTNIASWITKLSAIEDDQANRNDYARLLKTQVTGEGAQLAYPYKKPPPSGTLLPLAECLEQETPPPPPKEYRRYFCSTPKPKPPCPPRTQSRTNRVTGLGIEENYFVDADGMAKCIARSKGEMLAEFVADISRHTADKGHYLRLAMKVETAAFTEYVDRVLTNRLNDVADLLDMKQNQELRKIQKDYDKWAAEMSNCKKRLKELVPNFDIELYRKDKNYLKKLFAVDTSVAPPEDKFKEWKDEKCHRLVWFVGEINKLSTENNKVLDEISFIKSKTLELEQKLSRKQQCHADSMRTETAKYQELKQKSDKMAMEIADILLSLEN